MKLIIKVLACLSAVNCINLHAPEKTGALESTDNPAAFKPEHFKEKNAADIVKKELEDMDKTGDGFIKNTDLGETIGSDIGDDAEIDGPNGKAHAFHFDDGDEMVEDSDIAGKGETSLMENKNDQSAAADEFDIKLWPNGIVYYTLGDFPHIQVLDILNGMDFMNYNLKGCVQWKQKPDDHEGSFIQIKPVPAGCFAGVGYKAEHPTFMGLFPGCSFGSTTHEMLHVMGSLHEQERSDRDKYVTILEDNIQRGKANQFDKVDKGENPIDSQGNFDFGSIMMYSRIAFSKNNKDDTIQTNPKSENNEIGQRELPSAKDMEKIRAAYKCPPTVPATAWVPPHKKPLSLSSFAPLAGKVAVLRADGQDWKDKDRKVSIDICKKDGSPGQVVTTKLPPNFSISSPIFCKGAAADLFFYCGGKKKSCPFDAACVDKRCDIPFLNNDKPCEHKPCLNNGTCQETNGGYQCKCAPGFSGVICQEGATGF